MRTSDFYYDLPQELIAFYPVANREESRLMVLKRDNQKIEHRRFFDLPQILREGDFLVLNNTRVITSRLFGKKDTGREVEVLLTERLGPRLWKGIMKNPKNGMEIEFDGELKSKVLKDGKDDWLFEFGKDADDYIEYSGSMPLPPYIKRRPEDKDKIFYQTVYADKKGAVAAPTAGLHFTKRILEEISQKGIETLYITLHVGAGTFKPVKTENVKEHRINQEHREVSLETAAAINRAKKREGKRIVAVGTTVVRTLEGAIDRYGDLQPALGNTDLFIYPGFEFRVVDVLITNFHLPRSTLLMLVSAFAGREFILKAYEEAKESGYRFLSYGDAMVII
jgi:S-adenosylmethionine:tRNA ribosyltransferase-isomerase